MLRIYALDPEVASKDVTAFALFVNGLGVDNGRLMAEFPKRWRAMAIDGVQRIQSVLEAKRAEVLLTELATNPTLRTRLALPFEPTNTWLENALQHQTAFTAVISTDEQSAQDITHAAQAASSLLTAAPYWRADRYLEFKSHPEAFARLLKPLLQLADEAVFMDPFFDAQQDRYQRWR